MYQVGDGLVLVVCKCHRNGVSPLADGGGVVSRPTLHKHTLTGRRRMGRDKGDRAHQSIIAGSVLTVRLGECGGRAFAAVELSLHCG